MLVDDVYNYEDQSTLISNTTDFNAVSTTMELRQSWDSRIKQQMNHDSSKIIFIAVKYTFKVISMWSRTYADPTLSVH